MNIASALLNSVIKEQDLETWGNLQLHYLPKEFHAIYRAISKHFEKENCLPTFDDLKLSIPSPELKEQAATLECLETDSEP